MGNLVLTAFINYIKAHPEVLEKLIERLVQELLNIPA